MASLNILLTIFFLIPAHYAAGNGVPRSCEDVLSHYSGTVFKEGVYIIDPDGPGGVDPFQVTCTTRDDLPGHGVTLVPHQGGIMPQPRHYRYERYATFNYRLTEEQLERLTGISGKCRQFVRLLCFETSNFVSIPWWVSRQGWNMTNWGGAPTNSSKCACAIQNSCDRSNKYTDCNCQINDSVWRNDEGYLDDKRYLPVKEVLLRDIDGYYKEIYLMVKPMECYGVQYTAAYGIPKSCEDVLTHYVGTVFKEGVYTIDPDGAGGVDAFQVTCTTRNDLPGRGVTLVPHQGGIGPRLQHFQGPGNYTRYTSFDYRLTEMQLESLTRISGKCRQFVRFSCFEARNFDTRPWWVSRQGWNMTNWGGAPTNSSKCACAMKNSCDVLTTCNCRINDQTWRNDEGYLDDKRYLPVKKVQLRDIDEYYEAIYLMVQPMECYGALASGSPTEKCLCSLHAEVKDSTKAGPLLYQLPDLIYGQGYYDVWIDEGNQKMKVTDAYPHFFNTRKRRQILPSISVTPGTPPECFNVLQRCPVDCERLAKLKLLSMPLSTKISNGSMLKPLGQVMCENAGVTIPPPGSRIVAFYKTAPACGSSGSSTHIFSDNPTICCKVFTLPFTNQAYNVFNEKCSPNMDISTIFG